jgi:hypothetical protein
MTSQSLIRRPRLQPGERVRGEITSSKGQEVITSSKEQEARSEEYKQSGNLAAGFVPDPSFSSIPYNTTPVQTCAANTNSSAYSHARLQPKGHRRCAKLYNTFILRPCKLQAKIQRDVHLMEIPANFIQFLDGLH